MIGELLNLENYALHYIKKCGRPIYTVHMVYTAPSNTHQYRKIILMMSDVKYKSHDEL